MIGDKQPSVAGLIEQPRQAILARYPDDHHENWRSAVGETSPPRLGVGAQRRQVRADVNQFRDNGR